MPVIIAHRWCRGPWGLMLGAMPAGSSFDNLPGPIRAALWMSLSALGYAASATLVRYLSNTLPVFELAFLRNLFGLAFMLPWLMRVGLGALKTSRPGRHTVRGIISTLNMWCLFGALALAPVADVSAITFLMPIVASILAVVFLKERSSARQWAASCVAFGGALLVIRPGLEGFNEGLLLALGAVVAGSTVATLIKTLLDTDSPDTIATYLFLSHIVFGIIPALLVWVTPSLWETALLVLLGFLAALVQRSFNRAMLATDATIALPFNFSRLIWAALFGWLVFTEVPDVWTWVGGTLIFVCSVYIARITTHAKAGEGE